MRRCSPPEGYPRRHVASTPGILARGPWQHRPGRDALARGSLRAGPRPDGARPTRRSRRSHDRGSPSHDGWAARLAVVRRRRTAGSRVELQPMRWALRLVREDALGSLSVLCAVRAADGRWLAGRRAAWVATWAGRWALGAGGAVEVGEDPVGALARELEEEWSVVPETLDRGGARLPAQPDGDADRPGLAARRRRGHARPRARRARLVARRPGGVAGRGRRRSCGGWRSLLERER